MTSENIVHIDLTKGAQVSRKPQEGDVYRLDCGALRDKYVMVVISGGNYGTVNIGSMCIESEHSTLSTLQAFLSNVGYKYECTLRLLQ